MKRPGLKTYDAEFDWFDSDLLDSFGDDWQVHLTECCKRERISFPGNTQFAAAEAFIKRKFPGARNLTFVFQKSRRL